MEEKTMYYAFLDDEVFEGFSRSGYIRFRFNKHDYTFQQTFLKIEIRKAPLGIIRKGIDIGRHRYGCWLKFSACHHPVCRWTISEPVFDVLRALKAKLDPIIKEDRRKLLEYLRCERERRRGRREYFKRMAYAHKFSKRTRQILQDSRKMDRRRRRQNDLDLETIESLISKECSYCGATSKDALMTLDRMDGDLGHLKTNVVPSCCNCNLTRGNMPYQVWVELVAPGMRKARELGLLKGWYRTNRIMKKKQ